MIAAWIVMGNFNVVLHNYEKISISNTRSQIGIELRDFLDVTILHDHKYVGQHYT